MLHLWLTCVLTVLCGGDRTEPRKLPTLSDLKAMYYINLDDVPLRRRHIEQQLRATGLPAKRFPAVAAERVAAGEFNEEFIYRQGLDNSTLQLSPRVANATAACFLSHVMALRQMGEELQPSQFGLILEDDVGIPEDWASQMQAAMQAAPEGWHLLKVSGWGSSREADAVGQPSLWSRMDSNFWDLFEEPHKKAPEFKFFSLQEPFTDPDEPMKFFYAGTGAYLVRGSAIPQILRHLLSRPIKDVDSMLLTSDTSRFYEEWPHIFDLSKDAFGDTSMHSVAQSSFDVAEDAVTLPGGVVQRKHAHKRRQQPLVSDDAVDSEQKFSKRGYRRDHTRTKEHTEVFNVMSKGHFQREAPAKRTGLDQEPLPYGHPSWLHECTAIYLDVGSNIGVQVRKFFEPARYPGAPVLPLFDSHFGRPHHRTQLGTRSGVCALGFEPNPGHREHLEQLADVYAKKGWHVHFYPYAAWREEGTMSFDMASDPKNDDWGAHLSGDTKGKHTTAVRTVDFASFVKTLPKASVKLMKMDIEGAEYTTIGHMIDEKVLCQGSVDLAFIEAHAWGNTTQWKFNRSYAGIEQAVNGAKCDARQPTTLMNLDDESYHDDNQARIVLVAREELSFPGLRWWLAGGLLVTLVGLAAFFRLDLVWEQRGDKV